MWINYLFTVGIYLYLAGTAVFLACDGYDLHLRIKKRSLKQPK